MKKIILGLILLFLAGCETPEAQKTYLKKQQEMAIPQINQFKDSLANLNKHGIDKIYVDHDFWDEFNISQAQYLCGLKQKFFFYFDSTWINDHKMLGSNIKGKKAIYCSPKNLSFEPVYGNNKIYSDQFNKLMVFPNYDTTNGLKTNYNTIQAEFWEKNKPKNKQEKVEAMSSIKKTCKDFGFKEGTEKFAECLKDLYLKENTQQQSTQSIIVNDSGSQAIADEMKRQRNQQTTDELLNLSRELSKGKSLGEIYGGASPKSGASGGSCTLTNSVQSGTNRICYYRCGVSTQTSNVGAAQQCPLTM
jgi:hypothetical protein